MGEWIRVKERLPEPGSRVLVWFVDDNASIGGYCLDDYHVMTYGGMNDNQYFPIRDGARQGVTHWQPLPPPPEQYEQ